MYKMPEFTETDNDAILAFMKAHPFVMLTGCHNNIPVATQVPVLMHEQDGKLVLRGHIMRKTDHHLAFEANPNVLVLFTGAQCYVSASWYTERGIGSTWNYMTVQARGIMQYKDEAHCLQFLTDLTHHYEDPQTHPELLENMSREKFVNPMMKAIVSFEIPIDSVFATFKLSQNRDDESKRNIIQQLRTRGDNDSLLIAGEIEKRMN